jgi:hypothetical protein
MARHTVRIGFCFVFSLVVGAAASRGQETPEPTAAEGPEPTVEKGKLPPRLGYIDEMLAKAWQEAKLRPSAEATDAEYMRRAYLDIVGRIPNVEEARAFLASKEPSKRAKLIEILLANPDYPKNFGAIYTNLLIGRRTRDRQVDRAALNDWMRQQFAKNRPWQETAFDLITAKGSNKENGAVNYVLAHFADQRVNLTSSTTRVFLGEQIQCTQCHDHKYNDWKQQDFWGINAFFRGLRERPLERVDATGAIVRDGVEVYDDPTDEWAQFERPNAVVGVVPPTYLDGRRIDPGLDTDRRLELARFITESKNRQFARAFVNRMWGYFLGQGIVNPVDDFGDHNAASLPELLDQMAVDFIASGYDVKTLIRWITASRPYHLSSTMTRTNDKDEHLFSRYLLKPMSPEQLFDSLITATSAHKAAGAAPEKTRAEWLKQFVVAFANDEAGETSSFQGTIPQALMMMNGELMSKAVGGQSGSFLAHVVDQAQVQRKAPPLRFAVDQVYLAALSRYPDAQELKVAQAFLASNPDTLEVVQDLFWALLNSNEFVLNH